MLSFAPERLRFSRHGISIRGIFDARDKSRSLGFSPGTNFLSPLKYPLFFMDGAEQECSGYILCSASFSASPTKLQPAAAHMIVR